MAFQKLPQVQVTGRLTRPPELRFIPSGSAVATFTVAASERKKNQQTQEWEDGDKCFLRCTVWREEAENLAESDLQQGAEVTVTGELFQREYEKDGQTRQSVELKNCVVSAVVSRGQQVAARKVQRQQGQQQQQQGGWAPQGGGQQQGPPQGQQQGGWAPQPSQDPWAAPAQQQAQQQGQWQQGPPQGNQQTQGPWNASAQNQANGYDDEPPY